VRARLFAAVERGREARDRVAAEQHRLGHLVDRSALRLVGRDQLHLTLVFLGEVAPDRVPLIVAAMSPAFALAPFQVVFGGVGVFPARGTPRALWLGLRGGVPPLEALQAHVAARCASVGCAVDARPFTPHLTLARFRDGRPSDRSRLLGGQVGARVIAFEEVREVVLFESRLSDTGAAYAALCRAPLAGPALH
jgi:2'-5' RNA ligase